MTYIAPLDLTSSPMLGAITLFGADKARRHTSLWRQTQKRTQEVLAAAEPCGATAIDRLTVTGIAYI